MGAINYALAEKVLPSIQKTLRKQEKRFTVSVDPWSSGNTEIESSR